jgi:pimeloyl-ACP methyl ester carboxylesterase
VAPFQPRKVIAALAFATAVIVTGRALSAHFLFPVGEVPVAPAPLGFALLSARASDGVRAHAFALEGPTGAPVVVFFHNNRETAADAAALGRALHALGFGVLLVEYRGYGVSRDAVPDEPGLYADAEAALGELRASGIGAERIVLWGHSLGTGVAAEMARRGRGAALVLMSPYTSIDRLVTGVVPFSPASVLVGDRFDTLSKASAIRIPTLIIHGDADEIVPFAMGETLAGSIAGARFLRVRGAHHGDVLQRDGEAVLREVTTLAAPLRRGHDLTR